MKKKTKIKLAIAFLCCVTLLTFMFGGAKAETRETWISDDAYEYCYQIGNQYNICPELLMAVIEKESSGKSNATNGGCVGLMQVSARWHKDRMLRLGATELYCERDHILVAADYLAELFQK